jgi:protease secretion system outer membrane protein
LLPNASLSLSDARVVGSRTAPNFFGQPVTSDLGYRAPQQSVSVRMPLLNREASQRLQQAEAQAQLAGTQYAARQYELLERVAQAYLQRLYAQDGVRATDAQRLSAQELQRQAVRRLALGEGTRPELAQAEADLALAQVQLREARNQVTVAEQALANLMGDTPAAPPQLPADAPLPALQPDSEDAWQALAAAGSPVVAARRESVAVARLGVERASAGHYPRLDLVASVSNSRNETVSTLNQSVTQKSLGLQFNLPLYAGGGVEASVAQAVAQQAKAQAELDAELLDLQADIRRQFLFAQNGQDRLDAARQSRDAQALALQAARMAQVRGLGTVTDVLRAEGRLADAGRELAKARYDQLLGQLRLMARAGKPVDEILLMLDGALSPP